MLALWSVPAVFAVYGAGRVAGGRLGAEEKPSPSGTSGAATAAPSSDPSSASPGKSTIRPSKPDPGLLSVHARGATRVDLPSPVPMEPEPEGMLLVSAHTAGWITPCGCPGTQAGGVARRAGYGELLRKTFPGVGVHYFDLGGFLSGTGSVQRATAEAVMRSMERIGYEATNVAISDLGRTNEQADFLDRTLKTPRFSANVVFRDTGKLAYPAYRIVNFPPRTGSGEGRAPIRVGIIGLVDDRPNLFAFGEGGRSLATSSMSAALDRTIPELQSKADLIVLFAEVEAGRIASLLNGHPGIDFVVAGKGQDFVTEPRDVGGVPLVAVGNQGKYLAELRITRRDGKPAIVPFVHWLDESFPENPELAHYAESTLNTVNETSKRETAEDTTPPPAIAPFVGAPACQSCHEDAFKTWQASKHAHAMETLASLKRDYTVACVTCHITGYGADEGGFVNPRASAALLGVQCEACHGPGQPHLDNPGSPYGEVKKDLCKGCHSPATDPTFDYDSRWKTIAHR